MRPVRNSVLFTLALTSALGALSGCTIYTGEAARQHNRPTAPAAPAPGATATAATTATATTTTTAPPLDGPRVTVDGAEYVTLKMTVAFGSGTKSDDSFKGLVYFLPNNTTSLSAMNSLTPTGVLFAKSFNIDTGSAAYSQGFPGLDPNRFDYFGIKYEGEFNTSMVGEYQFRVDSDDGARLTVENVPLVNNDGVHPLKSQRGSIKLGAGPHSFKLEYFQAAKGPVALKVFVTPPGGSETLFTKVLLKHALRSLPHRSAIGSESTGHGAHVGGEFR